ncbi:MAG: DNA polymerase IV [Lachnospiraceae bacterium]|nr:DNA polymerase IV [Lachnospiraceae bacterium]
MEPIIFHIDVNSAYLSWSALSLLEKGANTDLRKIPAIIGGDMEKRHGVVLAKSIPAKKYGVTTGEPIVNALRKCPTLTIQPPDHHLYHARSEELMQLLRDVCPDIEQVSVDECFMDYTPIQKLYDSPVTAAHSIREQIRESFGYTVNIGVSDVKMLAKMASDFSKPDKVHTLFSWEIREKMWPLSVASLFMCGKSSVQTLNKLGIRTIGDLAQADRQILSAHLKSHGVMLWEYANGIDPSKVVPVPEEAKGIGNSITLSKDVTERRQAVRTLLSLSESVGGRLRAAGQLAGMVSVEIKYSSFRSVSHQTSLFSHTDSTQLIYETSCRLFDELWDGSPIRLLGIRTSRLAGAGEPSQLSLFDLEIRQPQKPPGCPESSGPGMSAPSSRQKLEALDKTLDQIRQKYGKDAVVRGSLLKENSPDNSRRRD